MDVIRIRTSPGMARAVSDALKQARVTLFPIRSPDTVGVDPRGVDMAKVHQVVLAIDPQAQIPN